RNRTAAVPDGVDRGDGIGSADEGRGKLSRRAVERVDDEAVVEPQVQRAAQHHGQRQQTLEPRSEGLIDAAREMQIPPHHHVSRTERHDRRLERLRDPRGVGADVIGELAVEPGPEGREEAHRLVLARTFRGAAESASRTVRDPPPSARRAAARWPTAAPRRPDRAPGAWSARSAACRPRPRSAPADRGSPSDPPPGRWRRSAAGWPRSGCWSWRAPRGCEPRAAPRIVASLDAA